MLKSLIKVQLQGLKFYLFNAINRRRKNSDKTKMPTGMLILYGFLAIYLMAIFTGMFFSIGVVANSSNTVWVLFALYFALSIFFVIMGSVFLAKVTLFDAKDNSLLLSMPIPPKHILLSRMLTLLILDFSLSLIITIPCFIAYLITCTPTFITTLLFVVMALLIPLFGLAITALLAWIFSLITSRMRHKTLFTTVMSFIFIIGIMAISFSVGFFGEKLNESTQIFQTIFSKFPPAIWFGKAIAEPNLLYFLGFALIFIGAFALTYYLLSVSFLKIATMEKRVAKVAFSQKRIKSGSLGKALLKHDFSRLGSSSAYLLNSCIGVVFALAFGVALISFSITGNNPFIEIENSLPSNLNLTSIGIGVSVLISAYIFSMIYITSPAISMEGKTFWILKSLPISANQFFFSKFLMQTIITAPSAILISVGMIMFFKPTGLLLLYAIITPLLISILITLIGLVMGIRHANLVWLNEAICVKRGKAVMLSMLLNMAFVFLITIICIPLAIFTNVSVALGLAVIITIVFCLLCIWYLLKGGQKKYYELS